MSISGFWRALRYMLTDRTTEPMKAAWLSDMETRRAPFDAIVRFDVSGSPLAYIPVTVSVSQPIPEPIRVSQRLPWVRK